MKRKSRTIEFPRHTYLHNLTVKEYDDLRKTDVTSAEIAERYRQPKWCSIPDPLGCWSLIIGHVKSKSYCKDCRDFREPTTGAVV